MLFPVPSLRLSACCQRGPRGRPRGRRRVSAASSTSTTTRSWCVRGQAARPPGQVDRDPSRGGQLDHPGKGLGGNRHAGRHQRRRDPRLRDSTALADMGAYTQNFTVAIPLLGLWVASGQYTFPTHFKIDCVITNTMTTDAYRGAGRPEAIYYLERIIDMYAREIGMDPLEVRKKNYWQPDQFPAASRRLGSPLDSGNYAGLRRCPDREGRLRGPSGRCRKGRGPRAGYLGIGVSPLRGGVRVRPGRPGRDRVLLGQLRAAGLVQWLGVGAGQSRWDRHRAHRDRTVRPGPSDHLGPDRLRRAGHPDGKHQGVSRRHRRLPDGGRHLRQPIDRGRRGRHP